MFEASHFTGLKDYPSSMSSGKKNTRGLMECPMCFEQFQEDEGRTPRILPECGHSVCHSCLQQTNDEESFQCPTCEEEYEIDQSDYPKNLTLLQVMLEREGGNRKRVLLDSRQTPKCEGSADCGFVEAFCAACSSSFCHGCFAAVHKIGNLKSHNAVAWAPELVVDAPPAHDMCPHHPGFPLNIFCQEPSCSRKHSLLCLLMCEKFGPEHKGHTSNAFSEVFKSARNDMEVLLAAVSRQVRIIVFGSFIIIGGCCIDCNC